MNKCKRHIRIMSCIREYLIKARKQRCIRQNVVAARVNKAPSTVSKWERGSEFQGITLACFIEWCEAVGLSPGNVMNATLDRVNTQQEIDEILARHE